ncbi:hypothetical protein ACYX7E_11235 [Luteimonas sp. RIT-PG2_3]
MTSTHRVYRFDRKAVRARWYFGPWIALFQAGSAVALVWLMGVQHSPLAWTVCAAWLAWLAWSWWRERGVERELWAFRQPIRVWFADGRLHVDDGHGQSVEQSFDQVAAVEAIEAKGRVVRLLVDRKDGARDVYAGYDDMDAFASEFRSQVRNVPFKRMRGSFSGGLKEVES